MRWFRRRRSVALRPLTLGLYLEALWVAGGDSKAPAFDIEGASAERCARLCDTLLAERPKRYTDDGAKIAAAQAWAAFMAMALRHEARAKAKTEAVERALGEFLDGGGAVTLERVVYQFEPADAETLLSWPLWRALEYLGVRAVEAQYRETERKLARTN
jgi:hypothetical protein